ncbi:hypothetical protein HTZ84_17740 [Haloterrigena sp. SYSU A558-1]|uniref:Chitin-binding type-3 domain-containing protein n=1 Tax=Haloterrigena gelatinilytica TaxID=2741724 RepID=A0A8J8GKJ8_9EURY|nr:hypothetical protein [Haloterrigena gelatinilytica]NUC74120.1 hypothetical protein [Haloterrigena gelatinilytica]
MSREIDETGETNRNIETTNARTPVRNSRRRFLQLGASALAATTLGASSVAARDAVTEACGSSDTLDVGDGDFLLINNEWGADVDMCIWAADDGTYGYEWATRTAGGEPNYPEVLLGTKPWGTESGVDAFPVPRGDVDELELTFDVDVDIDGENWNLAEEWWLMDGEPNPDGPHTHEIMLVLDWGDEHGHGDPVAPGAIEDAHGNAIDHWISYDSGGTDADFHIFRLADPTTSGTVDLTAIMSYVETEIGGVSDDLLLSGIEVGNEYWSGTSGDVTFDTLDVAINGRTYSSGDGSTVDDGDGSDGDSSDGDGSDGDNDAGGDRDVPAWTPDEIYTAGDRVNHDGAVWEAQWWTRGQEPRDEAWYVWQRVE